MSGVENWPQNIQVSVLQNISAQFHDNYIYTAEYTKLFQAKIERIQKLEQYKKNRLVREYISVENVLYLPAEESNKEISVRLGMMWKNLSSDTKENYYSASRKADEEHKRKYPGYYYSPKEARLRKNLKESLAPGKKKNCDAMRFVKLVMKENSDNERWRTVEQTDDRDVSVQHYKIILNVIQ